MIILKIKNKSKEKGITLIALVITIIVLLILAGVTINLTLGERGIFKVAQESAKATEEAEMKEEVSILLTEWWADYNISGIEMVGRSDTTARRSICRI